MQCGDENLVAGTWQRPETWLAEQPLTFKPDHLSQGRAQLRNGWQCCTLLLTAINGFWLPRFLVTINRLSPCCCCCFCVAKNFVSWLSLTDLPPHTKLANDSCHFWFSLVTIFGGLDHALTLHEKCEGLVRVDLRDTWRMLVKIWLNQELSSCWRSCKSTPLMTCSFCLC